MYVPPHRRDGSAAQMNAAALENRQDDIVRKHIARRDVRASSFGKLIERLCVAEIEGFASYDGVCPTCCTPYYGILDEGKLTIPISTGSSIKKFLTTRASLENVLHYEARMEIVRSGIWSREQLRGACFTQHELEVNDRAFLSTRPRRCDCDFGEYVDDSLTDYERAILAEFSSVEVPVMTDLESEFVRNVPVRTGFRRRSPAALQRRSSRRSVSRGTVFEAFVPGGVNVPSEMSIPATTVVLKFGFIPKARKSAQFPKGNKKSPRRQRRSEFRRKMRKVRARKCYPARVYDSPPHPGDSKYWYFYRKRGSWAPSFHRPLQGDSQYFGYFKDFRPRTRYGGPWTKKSSDLIA